MRLGVVAEKAPEARFKLVLSLNIYKYGTELLVGDFPVPLIAGEPVKRPLSVFMCDV